MLKTRKITDVYNMPVYTDSGEYFGEIDESILAGSKVFGWRVRATKKSYLNKVLGGAKGVIVPHAMVKSFGDVVIISKAAIPNSGSSEESMPVDNNNQGM